MNQMNKRILIVLLFSALSLALGCEEKAETPAETGTTEVVNAPSVPSSESTASADVKAEVEKEITPDNADVKADELAKELEAELEVE